MVAFDSSFDQVRGSGETGRGSIPRSPNQKPVMPVRIWVVRRVSDETESRVACVIGGGISNDLLDDLGWGEPSTGSRGDAKRNNSCDVRGRRTRPCENEKRVRTQA